MKPEYPPFQRAEECLEKAIRILAIGERDIRERMKHAWVAFFIMEIKDLPEKWRPDFESIYERLMKYPPEFPGEGRMDASVRRMKRKTAVRMADKLWDMYMDVRSLNED